MFVLPKRANRLMLTLSLFLVLSYPLLAQEESPEDAGNGSILISSDPMGAFLILDDLPLDQMSPCRIDDLPAGLHTLLFLKSGYDPVEVEIDIVADKMVTLDQSMSRREFIPLFDNADRIIFMGTRYEYSDGYLLLPRGDYKIETLHNEIKIDPVFPNQGLLTAANIALPTAALVSGLLTLSHFLGEPDDKQILSAPLITSYALTLAITAVDIGLNVQKARFKANLSAPPVITHEAVFGAQEAMIIGDRLLAEGRLNSALVYFQKVTSGYPDSVLMPEALYKSGKIHLLQSEISKAESILLQIVETYPLPDLFDKSCKTLADLYYQIGDYDSALNSLERMFMIDPLYSSDEIEEYKQLIQSELEVIE